MNQYVQCSLIITIIISGVALLISFFGLLYARRANRLSIESNKISKEAFLLDSRPYINIKIAKFDDTKSYLKLSKKNGRGFVRFRFKLTNVGKTPANNVRMPDIFEFGKNLELAEDFNLKKAPHVTIGPDQLQYFENELVFSPGDNSVTSLEQMIEDFESGQDGFTLQFGIFYSNILDPLVKYKTLVIYRITNREVTLLKREMY